MDLDDELMPNAIETIAKVYEDPNVWLTYGNYIDNEGRVFFDENNIEFETENFRQEPWKFIPLRTFRRELYEKLTNKDLFVPDTPVYPDANMLYCLLEMAGKEHIKAIPEVLYKYNHDHSGTVLNRFKDQKRRDDELNRVKAMKPKEKLSEI
jgi:hypothetical protein